MLPPSDSRVRNVVLCGWGGLFLEEERYIGADMLPVYACPLFYDRYNYGTVVRLALIFFVKPT
jgi:hypothetical protein